MTKKDYTKEVNHPQHYGGEGNIYETIEVLEAWLTYEEFIGFCKGNAIKYLSRAQQKGGKTDYKKAEWYLERMNSFINSTTEKSK